MATPPPPPKLLCGRSLLDLPGDLISEILLRLPPHDPRRLVRCSAVCKPWRRRLTDPDFLRRYRAFHGAPPMLGFLFNLQTPDDSFLARFVRTTSFRPRTLDLAGCYVRDARHGRILFSDTTVKEGDDHDLFVWNPVTGERRGLRSPHPFYYRSVAVLCAAAAREGGCDCDHLDCHGGPFLVAFLITDDEGMAYARVYSSETEAWSEPISAQHPDNHADLDTMDPTALVGNRIYFPAAESKTIVEYDLGRRKLAFVDPPSAHQGRGIPMPAMGGGLGFASVRGSRLRLWSREIGSDRTAAAWTQNRVLELCTLPGGDTRVPLNQSTVLGFTEILMRKGTTAVGFAEGLGAIFVTTSAGVFAINLESGQVKKMSSRTPDVVIPYMSFYTPDHATS